MYIQYIYYLQGVSMSKPYTAFSILVHDMSVNIRALCIYRVSKDYEHVHAF